MRFRCQVTRSSGVSTRGIRGFQDDRTSDAPSGCSADLPRGGGVDTARGSWLAGSHPEVTRKSRWSERLVGAPLGARARTLFCFGALFHDVIKTQLRVDGAGFLCQGDVANPKAETTDRMLLRPLCNNVTKILMIKSHNLRFRIKGFDVCLVLSLHTALQLSTCM